MSGLLCSGTDMITVQIFNQYICVTSTVLIALCELSNLVSQRPHFEDENQSSEMLSQFPKHTSCVADSGFKPRQCGPMDHAPRPGSLERHTGGARALTRPVPSTRRHCTESQWLPPVRCSEVEAGPQGAAGRRYGDKASGR